MQFRSLFRPRFASVLILLITLAQAVGLASAAHADQAAASATISIDNFTFAPKPLTVKVGTTVVWTNNDDIPHSIVDKDRKLFRSKALDTGDTFSFTLVNPGNYDYFCGLHPHMTGRVVVEP